MKWLHDWWSRCYGLEHQLQLLKHSNPKVRQKANDRIWDLTRTLDDRIRLITAAAETYPDADTSEWLIKRFWDEPVADDIPVIEAIYDRLETVKEGRESALRLLTNLKSKEALQSVARLLRRPSSQSLRLLVPFVPLVGGMTTKVDPQGLPLLKELLADFGNYDHLADRDNLLQLVVGFVEKKLIELDEFLGFQRWCVDRCQLLLSRDMTDYESMMQSPQDATQRYKHERVIEVVRSGREFNRLLTLMKSGSFSGAEEILRRGSQSHCEKLRISAVTAMVAKKMPVAESLIDQIAANRDYRYELALALENVGRLDLFPAGYLNRDSLAEAEMIHWLQYPTEMDMSPEQIEQLNVVTVDGHGDCYFFRFRHQNFKAGRWLVGLAGPYAPGETVVGGDWTFSHFDEWTEATVDAKCRSLISRHLEAEDETVSDS